jgi:hypothetical protein
VHTLFRDSQEPVLEHDQEWGVMINSADDSEMLHDKLKPVIWSEHQVQLSQGVVLFHDNTCPHTAILFPTLFKHPSSYALRSWPCTVLPSLFCQ